jgi:hypothetical protein
MRTSTRRAHAAALTAVAIAVATGGCTRGTSPAPAAPTASPDVPDIVIAIPEVPAVDPLDIDDLTVDLGIADQPIDRLPYEGDTDGTGPQIALRFLRALQRHDDTAAARTLTDIARLSVSLHGAAHLRRVLADIAANARLAQAGPCTTARRLNPDAAVVTCSARRIVVHVSDGFYTGVQLAPWHPRGDVYRGPHTNAYSAIDL